MSEDTGGHRVPLRLTLYSIAALWGCYFVVATLRSTVMGLEFSPHNLLSRLAIVVLSMSLFALLIPLVRLLDRARPGVRLCAVLVGALPVALLLAGINNVVFEPVVIDDDGASEKRTTVHIRDNDGEGVRIDVLDDDGIADEGEDVTVALPGGVKVTHGGLPKMSRAEHRQLFIKNLVEVAFGRYFLVLAWAAIYFAMVKGEEARLAERREGEFRQAAANAEVRSLRYQVNPHFLFNTLNSLSALVMTGRPERAEEMIQTLSTYYRRTLASDPTADVTLGDEIALQRLYLDIEAVRFPERLQTRVEVATEVADALVPGMILQPIVENSVKYAVAACHEPVTISILAQQIGDRLVVTVSDDGPMTDTGDRQGFGIGLGNVRDRLRARFGDDATVAFGPRDAAGFETVLTMPLQRKDR
jgi:two-component system LytT family sensor kinase